MSRWPTLLLQHHSLVHPSRFNFSWDSPTHAKFLVNMIQNMILTSWNWNQFAISPSTDAFALCIMWKLELLLVCMSSTAAAPSRQINKLSNLLCIFYDVEGMEIIFQKHKRRILNWIPWQHWVKRTTDVEKTMLWHKWGSPKHLTSPLRFSVIFSHALI